MLIVYHATRVVPMKLYNMYMERMEDCTLEKASIQNRKRKIKLSLESKYMTSYNTNKETIAKMENLMLLLLVVYH